MRKSLFNEDSVTNSNIWWKVEQVHCFDSFSFVKFSSMCNRCNVNITVNYIFRSIQLANMSWWNTLNFGQPFENAIIPSIIKLERIRWFFYQKFNKVIYKEWVSLSAKDSEVFSTNERTVWLPCEPPPYFTFQSPFRGMMHWYRISPPLSFFLLFYQSMQHLHKMDLWNKIS